jgi:hypothetical protein
MYDMRITRKFVCALCFIMVIGYYNKTGCALYYYYYYYYYWRKSRDSSVGIALGYRLDDRGSRVRFPAGGWEFFSSPPRPERFWGPPMGNRGSFPGGKAAGA